MPRRYAQNCALALGLDVVGERWTLLLVRELLTGPRRYSELAQRLPGIGSNLLAARLKALTRHGIIEKADDADPSSGYRLTGRGEQLRPIVHALIRWGHQFRGLARPDDLARPEWDMLAVEAAFRPERAGNARATIELTLSGFTFHVVIAGGRARCLPGAADAADVKARTSTARLLYLHDHPAELDAAIARGDVGLSGSREAFRLLFELFDLDAADDDRRPGSANVAASTEH